jgi:serine/threonine protein kinase
MNEPDTFQNRSEKEIFLEALDKNTPQERAAFLDGACGKDSARRARVEALLADHFKEDGFMNKPAAATREEPVRTIKLDTAVNADDNAVGQTIGRYKLLEKVGEGGCGAVYVAQQYEPVRRRVALKVIKLGMDTKEVIARFEAERQALAMMDHPNIAKVFDAGTTETGRPYFVMELVRGIKITEYCDQNQLNTKERLALLIEVCHAVQHAHQKGIIHRDIKPSNIMVTLHDGVPVPKVIDFGIAKATEGRLTDETVYTQLHQFIGTPAYMSPEQAEMSGLDIDTRSDIYSLGVLLYELLAGSTPFDAKELMASGLDAMRKIIREQEPIRPSTRLATLHGADLTTTAKRRSTDSSKLLHQLRGDLDWIVMKCLEKDRARRYETANGLAADLERHLDNEPVVARPPSAAYRLQKAWRRNKAAFTAATLIAVALLAATGISAWQAILARQRFAESEAISKFLTQVFQSPDPARDGRTITVAETLSNAVAKLETDLTNQPARRAKLQATLGSTYFALGLYREAIALREKVRDYCLAAYGPEHPDTLSAMDNLARSYGEVGRSQEAIKLGEQVLPLSRKVLGPEHPFTLTAMSTLAISYWYAGRREEALKLQEDVLALSRKVNGAEHTDTLKAMNNMAISYWYGGRQDEALKMREEVLTLARKMLGPEHPTTLTMLFNLSTAYDEAGRREEALKLREEALPLMRKVLGPEHPDTLQKMADLANSYYVLGHRDEALKLLEEGLAIRRKVNGQEHPDNVWTMEYLAKIYDEADRRDDAIKMQEEVLALREQMLALCRKGRGLEHIDTLNALNAIAWRLAISDAAEIRNGTKAVNYAQEAVAGTHRTNALFLDTLAAAFAETQQFDKAAVVQQEAIGLAQSEQEKKDYASRLQLYQANKPYRVQAKP